jgi:hypothetical protein
MTKDQTDPNLPTLNYKSQQAQKNFPLLNRDLLQNLPIVEEQPLNRPLAKFFKAPLKKGGWGDQSFFLQEV